MIAGHSKTQRAELLRLIVEAGERGMTDAEMEAASGLRASTISPRRGELRTLGLIVDTGLRRPTPRGRPAAVWVATTLGGTSPTKAAGASDPPARLEGGGA